MNEYITVKCESAGEYSEKHSRFLGFAIPCGSERQAAEIIAEKRKEYWDARHAVYAYVLSDGTARFSDDGEPHGTAGKPVLDVLKSSNLENVLIVVVRYFGGILLGTGGLVRAYTAAACAALEKAEKFRIAEGDEFSATVGYGDYDRLVFLLKEEGAEITGSDFSDSVNIKFSLRSYKSAKCLERINEAFSMAFSPEFVKKVQVFEKI